ncbi:tyrosine-type recombinase/integrase [Pseudochelatococcus sp. G4_1912]|uniref:tyrosine-type recombinase/integrase n=1 Tax=Pseudochelatococcus sp. G4_1912 TaxID=3114288 RepID=UPI0039C5CBDA
MPLILTLRGKIWYVRGTIRKQSVFESTGTSNRKAAEAIRTQIENRLLTESIFGKKSVISFEEAADSYISAGGSQRFILEIKKSTGKPAGLAVHFQGRTLHTITQNDLDEAARTLYPEATPETRNRQCHSPFIAIWNHAVINGWADKRTWQRPRKQKGTANRSRTTRAGSTPISYDIASGFISLMSPAPAMVMTALFYTGMRPIELFCLEAEDIDIEQRWITIQSSKTGEPRGVPMHEFIVPLFASLSQRGGILFRTYKGKPYPLNEDGGGQIKTAILGARKRSGIANISPYTARHSVSTQLVINGIHPYIKDQILGHAVDSMSRRYTRVPQAPLIEAINTLPVPKAWQEMPWLEDPLSYTSKLIRSSRAQHALDG